MRLGDSFSTWRIAESGVPQGSSIGPPLFLLYNSDLRLEIVEGVGHATFADDTKIFSDVSKPGGYIAMQCTLDDIEKWSNRWKLRISPSKSATSDVFHDETHQYTPFNETIDEVDVVKDLGIFLSSDLKPEFHIQKAVAKAGRTANFFIRAFDCRIPSVYIVFTVTGLLYCHPCFMVLKFGDLGCLNLLT